MNYSAYLTKFYTSYSDHRSAFLAASAAQEKTFARKLINFPSITWTLRQRAAAVLITVILPAHSDTVLMQLRQPEDAGSKTSWFWRTMPAHPSRAGTGMKPLALVFDAYGTLYDVHSVV